MVGDFRADPADEDGESEVADQDAIDDGDVSESDPGADDDAVATGRAGHDPG